MQVRLLVDGEQQIPVLHLLEDGEADVPPGATDLAPEVVLGDDGRGGDRVTGVDAVEGLDVLVAQVPLLERASSRAWVALVPTSLNSYACGYENGLRAVDPGLDVPGARGGDDTGDEFALADQTAGTMFLAAAAPAVRLFCPT